MSNHFRDKDKWKVRQLVKSRGQLFTRPASLAEVGRIHSTVEYQKLKEELDDILKKYEFGLNAYGGRKGSTRKAVADRKRIERRIKKRVGQREAIEQIISQTTDTAD